MADSCRPATVPSGTIGTVLRDPESRYAAVAARDPRFDGQFIVALSTTMRYCGPLRPLTRPTRRAVEFFPSAAAALGRGYQACAACLSDSVPGSPEWNSRDDLTGRAIRLITDGVVDRDGVPGLARKLGYSNAT